METSEIRDKLLEKRALQQQAVQQAKLETERFIATAAGLTDGMKEQLMTVLGDKYVDICSFDIEKLQTDAEYAEACQQKIDVMVVELHKYLEAELRV